jgi:hypothetical protein
MGHSFRVYLAGESVFVCKHCQNHLAVGESVLSKVSVFAQLNRFRRLCGLPGGKGGCAGSGLPMPACRSLVLWVIGYRLVSFCGGLVLNSDSQIFALTTSSNSQANMAEHSSYDTCKSHNPQDIFSSTDLAASTSTSVKRKNEK